MFNSGILGAIIVQWIITKINRIAGAVAGFLITTGILVWGLSVYSEGGEITFIGIPLPLPLFIILCLVWYAFDINELVASIKAANARKALFQSPLLNEERVLRFYQNTADAWAGGKLAKLNRGFEGEGKVGRDGLIKKYPPIPGSALGIFFERFQPLEGEYIVGVGNLQSGSNPGWFILTNLRLIQRDGKLNDWQEVALANVAKYQIKGMGSKTLTFTLKSGQQVIFEKVSMYPIEKYINTFIVP